MKTDIEISNEAKLNPIEDVAKYCGIPTESLEHYGKYIAKVPYTLIDEEKVKKSNLILVTAILPTAAGIGKTTVSIGLSMALNRLGVTSVAALREPSLGPCFGLKGGACGGGYSQVLPMDKINLHFTGDFHAVTSAHNTITALLENYVLREKKKGVEFKEILWNRVLDVNDRSLRNIVTNSNNFLISRHTYFDITPASEIMAIICLSTSMADLRERIGNILLGFINDDTDTGKPLTVNDLGITGAICALLKDAINPNLVQTTENTPAIIHGGPFANIAHGCNSILATKMAMTFSDYAVTEAGFGVDLGAEKFLDIKCRVAGIKPSVVVLVATVDGIKNLGEHEKEKLNQHIRILKNFGITPILAINAHSNNDYRYNYNGLAEDVNICFVNPFRDGGEGCAWLALEVMEQCRKNKNNEIKHIYPLNAKTRNDIKKNIKTIVEKVYNDGNAVLKPNEKREDSTQIIITYTYKALCKLKIIEELGYASYPICIAKTQKSFLPEMKDNILTIKDIVINAGAKMLVVMMGDIMRMPGLPEKPTALKIDVDNDGKIVGLS